MHHVAARECVPLHADLCLAATAARLDQTHRLWMVLKAQRPHANRCRADLAKAGAVLG